MAEKTDMAGDADKPWLSPKAYGYAAVPMRWEGWAAVLAFAA